MNSVYIETYGCAANKNNSEILLGILRSSGYQITSSLDIADIVIINSCIVKGKTENKIMRRIQDLASGFKDKILVLTGCMPETNAKQIKNLCPDIILLGTHHFKDITKILKDYKENKLDWKRQDTYLETQKEEKLLTPKIPDNNLISITQISEGCLGNCTYCKTRKAKGSLYSYPIDKIVKSIESDLKNGAKEVWITSQDCANYGQEGGKLLLPELLNKILNLKHRFKLRLGMMDPNNVAPILNDLIEVYKNNKMFKFLHIPVQSGSNKVLKDMNRLYTIKDVQLIIDKFKSNFSDSVISTDIIVGYPTETDNDFQKSVEFVKRNKFDVFNLSKMSIHKGTLAEKFKALPIDTINKRTTQLMKLHRLGAKENKQKHKNKTVKVFVDKKIQGNLYEARDDNYNIILINTKEKIIGKNVFVKINEVGVHHMIGEAVF
ncbi:tRNA (N(6)-L-threonylcarbamoyladenosine(37)-C(2))-methylthiotransferase [Candidatus Pacearchaeota archaeon]|nr:tRNA (N(6)-L-threonylcarbamoyladenosine(37)-C(2))-methylthiotransferase [Candidatus Pacearchaeota archaeon]